jgi:hypothetical protein
MGFMDKVKAQATVLADKAQTGVQQGQTKIQEMQSGKQADHLLRELGAHVFLSQRGRAQPDNETVVTGIMGQLDALEAAGTAVTITTDLPGAPDGGAPPPSGYVPRSGASSPADAPAPPTAQPAPESDGGSPQTGSAIPKSGGGLPGQ